MTASGRDRDYVLGTHDEEIARLGIQHRVWRSAVQDSWRRAGFGPGQWPLSFFGVGQKRLVDIGAFSADRAASVEAAVRAHQTALHPRIMLPVVGEILATKR